MSYPYQDNVQPINFTDAATFSAWATRVGASPSNPVSGLVAGQLYTHNGTTAALFSGGGGAALSSSANTLALLGDSLTSWCKPTDTASASRFDDIGYYAWAQARSMTKVNVFVSGWPGAKAEDVLIRTPEIIAKKPKACIVHIGANDVFASSVNPTVYTESKIKSDIAALWTALENAGITVITTSIYPYEIPRQVSFSGGDATLLVGATITQGAVSAKVQGVRIESGVLSLGTGAGMLLISTPTGGTGNFVAGVASDGTNSFNLAGAQVVSLYIKTLTDRLNAWIAAYSSAKGYLFADCHDSLVDTNSAYGGFVSGYIDLTAVNNFVHTNNLGTYHAADNLLEYFSLLFGRYTTDGFTNLVPNSSFSTTKAASGAGSGTMPTLFNLAGSAATAVCSVIDSQLTGKAFKCVITATGAGYFLIYSDPLTTTAGDYLEASGLLNITSATNLVQIKCGMQGSSGFVMWGTEDSATYVQSNLPANIGYLQPVTPISNVNVTNRGWYLFIYFSAAGGATLTLENPAVISYGQTDPRL